MQRLVDEGILTQEQAEAHPDSNVITRALGRESVEVDLTGSRTVEIAGNTLLLCSDGLNGAVPDTVIGLAMRSLPAKDAVNALIKCVHNANGTDNVTVAVVRQGDPIEPLSMAEFEARAAEMMLPENAESQSLAPVLPLPEGAGHRKTEKAPSVAPTAPAMPAVAPSPAAATPADAPRSNVRTTIGQKAVHPQHGVPTQRIETEPSRGAMPVVLGLVGIGILVTVAVVMLSGGSDEPDDAEDNGGNGSGEMSESTDAGSAAPEPDAPENEPDTTTAHTGPGDPMPPTTIEPPLAQSPEEILATVVSVGDLQVMAHEVTITQLYSVADELGDDGAACARASTHYGLAGIQDFVCTVSASCGPAHPQDPNTTPACVDRRTAEAFCRALSEHTEDGFYARLPNATEWLALIEAADPTESIVSADGTVSVSTPPELQNVSDGLAEYVDASCSGTGTCVDLSEVPDGAADAIGGVLAAGGAPLAEFDAQNRPTGFRCVIVEGELEPEPTDVQDPFDPGTNRPQPSDGNTNGNPGGGLSNTTVTDPQRPSTDGGTRPPQPNDRAQPGGGPRPTTPDGTGPGGNTGRDAGGARPTPLGNPRDEQPSSP